MVLLLADHRDFQVAVRFQVAVALVVHVVFDMPAVVPHRCPGPASQKAVEIPLLQFFDKDSDMPVVVQQQALVSTCRQLRSYRSCSSACSPWRFQGAVHGHGCVHAHSPWRPHRRSSG